MDECIVALIWVVVLAAHVFAQNVGNWAPLYVAGVQRGNYSSLKFNRSTVQIKKVRLESHSSSRMKTDSRVSIQWDYKDFGIQFESNGPAFKLRRAPGATLGEPWPLPQVYRTDIRKVYRINENTFHINTENYTCQILQNAIQRYTDSIFKYALEEFNENLKYLKNGGFNHKRLDNINEEDSTITEMVISLRMPCQSYPDENSDESYSLLVKPLGVFLHATEVWGALRGLETFSQLVYQRQGQYYIKDTVIEDFPRFRHRGILIDSSRHFIKKSVIFDVIDGMVQNKMNVLHWHIVDDQSFPYESRIFPNLSYKGAYHPALVYKAADIADIIEYARVRAVRVIPEFDTPGHTFSWGFGHPELLTQCYANYRPVSGYFGPMDPSKNYTFTFLSELFREIFNVFSDRTIHLGGDEVPLTCWASNPDVKMFLSSLGNRWNTSIMRDPMTKVWNYFVNRLTENLKNVSKEKGIEKRFIMWEEALKNKLQIPKDTIIQIWLGGAREIQQAIERGHQVIYSTCWYLDWVDHGVHWPKYYRCDPSPIRALQKKNEKFILGGEACLWSEYITNENVISMLWPRASAVAERLWSNSRVTDVMAASVRLQEHRCRMLRRGLSVGHINGPDYCLPPPDPEMPGPVTDSLGDHIHTLRLHTKPVLWIGCNNDLQKASLLFSAVGILMVLTMFGFRLRALFRFI